MEARLRSSRLPWSWSLGDGVERVRRRDDQGADKGASYVINKSVTDKMYFSPGTATVKSGQTLTFMYDGQAR